MPSEANKKPSKHILRAFLHFLAGFSLLPLCWAFTAALFTIMQPTAPVEGPVRLSLDTWALIIGFGLWVAIYFFLPVSARSYIWAHELTHALWALLSGAKVGKIVVRDDGGYVMLSRTNALIGLAPYFFPFYALITIGLWCVLCRFVDPGPWRALWLFVVGLSWGHHVTYTIASLAIKQPDIIENGHVFSYAVIYLFNICGICLWVIATTPATFAEFLPILGGNAIDAYLWTADNISALCGYVASKVSAMF